MLKIPWKHWHWYISIKRYIIWCLDELLWGMCELKIDSLIHHITREENFIFIFRHHYSNIFIFPNILYFLIQSYHSVSFICFFFMNCWPKNGLTSKWSLTVFKHWSVRKPQNYSLGNPKKLRKSENLKLFLNIPIQ